MMTVLVTGATGEVGRAVVPLLEPQFTLRLLALDAPSTDPRCHRADLLDRAALARAMTGAEAVLHLAVAAGHSGTYEDDAFNDLRFEVNVKGTHRVFETAQRLGVRRVVYVSSLMVVWGHRGSPEAPVPGDAPARPVGTYALTKALAEQITSYYSSTMEVIALRIAAPLDVSASLQGKAIRPQCVPVPDLVQAFALALTVPLSRYEVVTVVGDSSRRCWDLEPARRVLGYRPGYYLDDLGVTFLDPFAVSPT